MAKSVKRPTQAKTLQERVQQGDAEACWILVQQAEQQAPAANQLEAQNRINLLNYAAQNGIGAAAVTLGRWYLQGHYVPADMAKAIVYFELAGSLGKDGLGYYHLAEMFQTGVGVAADSEKGLQYLQKAVALGQPDATFTYAQQLLNDHPQQAWKLLTENYSKRQHLPSLQFIGDTTAFDAVQIEQWLLNNAEHDIASAAFLAARYWQQGDHRQALPWAERAAQAQHPIGSYIRAMLEMQHEGGDMQFAQQLLLAAAQQGHIEAAYQVGMSLLNQPNLSDAQIQSALQWLAQAAHSNHAGAQFVLGQCWLDGFGVEAKNQQEAVTWFERAAAQGHIEAIFNLALQLPRDHEQHLPLLLHAAEAGHSKAILCVGLYYQQTEQPEQAIQWFERAQATGDARADYLLGLAYRDGLGVAVDGKKAVELFNSAAEKGDADGYFTLYESYRDGVGVRKNKKSQAKYLKLAKAAQHPLALEIQEEVEK